MFKKILCLAIFYFFISALPAQAVSSAETSGLGSLSLELEYARQFQTPPSQTVLVKLVHGLSNQVDIKLELGSFGIESNGGFIYGAGFKWALLQETHARPAVSLNLEFLRGAYSIGEIPESNGNIKVESSFFVPSILISKNLVWFIPFMETGYDFADIRARNTQSGAVVSSLQGSSNTWFVGVGGVLEFDITVFVLEAIYDFDTPLGEGAFKAKAGFNLLL